jgi:hypothetical protein
VFITVYGADVDPPGVIELKVMGASLANNTLLNCSVKLMVSYTIVDA